MCEGFVLKRCSDLQGPAEIRSWAGQGQSPLGKEPGEGWVCWECCHHLSLLLGNAEDPRKIPRILLLEAISASAQFNIRALDRAAS